MGGDSPLTPPLLSISWKTWRGGGNGAQRPPELIKSMVSRNFSKKKTDFCQIPDINNQHALYVQKLRKPGKKYQSSRKGPNCKNYKVKTKMIKPEIIPKKIEKCS